MYQSLADIMGFETIPAICTGDLKEDNFRNARLYTGTLHEFGLKMLFKKLNQRFMFFNNEK